MKNNKQILLGATVSYATIIFNIVSGLLYTPWMIRSIGDDQYALYTLASSVISMFLVDFGVSSAVSKFLSNYYAEGKEEEANAFMGIVYKVFICISILIACCLTVFYFFIDGIYTNLSAGEIAVYKRLFVIAATFSVLFFPCTVHNHVLMANERFVAVKLFGLGQRVANVVLIIIAIVSGLGVYAMVLSHAVSNVIFSVGKYLYVRNSVKVKAIFSHWNRGLARKLFDYSIWVTVGNIAGRFVFLIMPTIVAALIGSAEITIFSLAASLEGYVFTFSDAINGMFLPRISRILVNENTDQKLSLLMKKVGRFHVGTIGLVYVGFVCLGQSFVDLWMGQGYDLVYICALLLIFPSLIDVPQQIARTTLLAKDVVKEQAFIYVGMAFVNVVACFIIIPKIGIVGAALSVCLAFLFRTAVFNVLYHKKLNVNLRDYFRATYGRWCVVAVVTSLLGGMINRLHLNGWVGLSVKIVLLTSVYAVLYLLVVVNKKERRTVINWVRHRREK